MSQEAIIIAFVEDGREQGRLWRRAEEALANGALLICADGGGEVALAWNLHPDWLVGDMDSISPASLAALQALPGLQVRRVPVEKDETDLELALYTALEAGASTITILGGLGGRLDHTLGNIYLLAAPRLAGTEVRLLSEREEVRLLRGGETAHITGQPGELLSLVPLSAVAQGVRTLGLYYPLHSEALYLGPSRGISNVLVEATATISFDEGLLLLVHTFA